MDTQTVLFIVSIVGCAIGVATFITGMVSRAKNDGALIGKVDYICTRIDEMREDMKTSHQQQSTLSTKVTQLELEVDHLKERFERYENRTTGRGDKAD